MRENINNTPKAENENFSTKMKMKISRFFIRMIDSARIYQGIGIVLKKAIIFQIFHNSYKKASEYKD